MAKNLMREDVASSLPEYFSINQDIIGLIRAGKLTPGMRIPSENQIIEKCGVSNTTARRALQELNSGQWVVKIKGKGTFVHGRGVVRSIDRILGFTRNMTEAGFTPLHEGRASSPGVQASESSVRPSLHPKRTPSSRDASALYGENASITSSC